MQRLLLVILAFFLLLLACSREEEKAKGPQPGTKKEAGEPQLPPREAYQRKVAAQLEKLERQVKQLKAAVDRTPPADRAKLQALTGGLPPKLEAARQKFKELQGAPDPAWQGLQPALDAALANLEKSYEQANQAARSILQEQKAAYQKQVAAGLRQKVRQVEALHSQVRKLAPKVRANLYQDLEDLQKKMILATRKYRELRAAAPERWGEMTAGMDAALKDLHKSYLATLSHYHKLTAPKKKRPPQGQEVRST